jgi:hypothetical protein
MGCARFELFGHCHREAGTLRWGFIKDHQKVKRVELAAALLKAREVSLVPDAGGSAE